MARHLGQSISKIKCPVWGDNLFHFTLYCTAILIFVLQSCKSGILSCFLSFHFLWCFIRQWVIKSKCSSEQVQLATAHFLTFSFWWDSVGFSNGSVISLRFSLGEVGHSCLTKPFQSSCCAISIFFFHKIAELIVLMVV